MPKESTSLAGAFSSGKGLKETKEEKRERLELKELESLCSPAAWATPTLLTELRAAGKSGAATRLQTAGKSVLEKGKGKGDMIAGAAATMHDLATQSKPKRENALDDAADGEAPNAEAIDVQSKQPVMNWQSI